MTYTERPQRLPGHPDYSYPARHSWWSSQSHIGSVQRKAEPHIIARHLSSLIAQGHKPPRLPFKCTWSFTPKLSVMMNLNGLAGKMLEKALSLMTPIKDPDLQLWGAAPAYAVERAPSSVCSCKLTSTARSEHLLPPPWQAQQSLLPLWRMFGITRQGCEIPYEGLWIRFMSLVEFWVF